MNVNPLFRDYKLEIFEYTKKPLISVEPLVVIESADDHNSNLRLKFDLMSAGSVMADNFTVPGSFFSFKHEIYNLSKKNIDKINTQTNKLIRFSAGYKESLLPSANKTTQMLISRGQTFNSSSHRERCDVSLKFHGMSNGSDLNEKIKEEDFNKYAPNFVEKTNKYTRKQIFKALIDKYLKPLNVTIDDSNLKGFDKKYTPEKEEAQRIGFKFTNKDTITTALNKVCGLRPWHISPIGVIYVEPPLSWSLDAPIDIDMDNLIELTPQTGLLGVPIMDPSGMLTGRCLLHPGIAPGSIISIKTAYGLNQPNEGATSPAAAYKTVKNLTSRVMWCRHLGDTRSSAPNSFITEFTLNPPELFKSANNKDY